MGKLTRRGFIGGAAASIAMSPSLLAGKNLHLAGGEAPLRFLLMADHHIESDFVQSFGADKGQPVYTCWKPGNHADLVKTYRFISTDAFCRTASFALFAGDQVNTGYLSHAADRDAELANYHRTLESLDLHRLTRGTDLSDLKFSTVPSFTCNSNCAPGQAPVTFACRPPESRVIAIQGNHDTAVGEFYRECAFSAGDTRFITFFARYVGLPPPRPGAYASTGKISDRAIEFIAREMKAANADPAVRHIVLVSHWAIAPKGEDFACPIVGACPQNGMSQNRDRLLALCERYGCDLYLNGHEHNGRYPIGHAGPLTDVNCGTVTDSKGGAFAIVEMYPDRALFHVYARAVGDVPPHRLFVREVPLKAKGV